MIRTEDTRKIENRIPECIDIGQRLVGYCRQVISNRIIDFIPDAARGRTAQMPDPGSNGENQSLMRRHTLSLKPAPTGGG